MIGVDRSQFTLFHGPDQTPYASYEVTGPNGKSHRETVAVTSRRFRAYIRASFGVGAAGVTDRDLDSAIDGLAAEAIVNGPERVVHRRVALHGSSVIEVDLGDPDWRAVRVTADGWEIVERSEALFVRNELMRALPEPVHPGSVESLRVLMPNLSEDGLIGVTGFLMGLFNPDGTYPVLCVTGEQGVGKSTLVSIIRGLSDPGDPTSTPLPKDELGLGIYASEQHLLVFDNISLIKDPMSDALCRLASGTGQVNRKYYTNSDVAPLRYRNPVALTALGNPIAQPDLLDRTIAIEVDRLSQDLRRTDAQVELLLSYYGPTIFGGVLTAVSTALRNHYRSKSGALSRLVDHEVFVSAGESAFGWEPGTYSDFLMRNRAAAQLEVVDHSAVAQAVIKLVSHAPNVWTGTMTDLLNDIYRVLGNSPAPRSGIPQSANKLAYEMRKITPVLRVAGIRWEHLDRSSDSTRSRLLRIYRTSDVDTINATTVEGSGSIVDSDNLDNPDNPDNLASQNTSPLPETPTAPRKWEWERIWMVQKGVLNESIPTTRRTGKLPSGSKFEVTDVRHRPHCPERPTAPDSLSDWTRLESPLRDRQRLWRCRSLSIWVDAQRLDPGSWRYPSPQKLARKAAPRHPGRYDFQRRAPEGVPLIRRT